MPKIMITRVEGLSNKLTRRFERRFLPLSCQERGQGVRPYL
jgi:hypothetical protein